MSAYPRVYYHQKEIYVCEKMVYCFRGQQPTYPKVDFQTFIKIVKFS